MSKLYRPFGQKDIIETDHGIINLSSRRYFTHRRKNHYFVKYGGFGISTTELNLCNQYMVDNVVIKYHGIDKNILYYITIASADRDWETHHI